MEGASPWKLVKAGFWLGIGFIIPTLLVTVLSVPLMFAAPLALLGLGAGGEGLEGDFDPLASLDRTASLEVIEYRGERSGSRLLVFGKLRNTSEDTLSSVTVEAELLDAQGGLVFECTQFIQRVAASAEENFQITCGCGDGSAPEYDSIAVKVTGASSF